MTEPVTDPTKPSEPTRPPELEPAWQLIESGNFRAARANLDAVLSSAPAAELAQSARQMRAALGSDPWARRLAVAALALWVLLTYIYV